MRYLDIHTHPTLQDKDTSRVNAGTTCITCGAISVGIHPWHITEEWETTMKEIKERATRECVKAIGECGIDLLKSSATPEVQEIVLRAHALLSEMVQKPLIIHCIKAYDRLISLRKEIHPTQAWIIHGFRGKPQQAEQLIKNGFYISFGEKFNANSIKATPMEKLFVESDVSCLDIHEIYQKIAEAKECPVAELAAAVIRNAEKCNLVE